MRESKQIYPQTSHSKHPTPPFPSYSLLTNPKERQRSITEESHHLHNLGNNPDHASYPAHLGPRKPKHISPVLSRGPSGNIEILPLHKRKGKEPEEVEQKPESSGSGSGESSGTAVNDSEEITRLEGEQEVVDWALRLEGQKTV